MRFKLRFKRRLRKATNASKITINKREARNNAKEAKEIKVKARRTKTSAKANARATTITTTTTIIIINKKRSSKLCKQFACTYISFVLETTLMLLSYLLLFNNSREYINNALYNQRLIKLLN